MPSHLLRLIAVGAAFLASAQGEVLVSSFTSGQVLRYAETTGALLGAFATNALSQPFGLRFGPDGFLYVVSGNGASVQRFHGSSGAWVDAAVPSGSGGLSLPVSAAFGPDGTLYTASFANNKVARFDVTTGAALGDFVTPGSGGLTGPNFFTFRPPATGLLPAPTLAVNATNLLLSWPTSAVGWTAQTNSALAPGGAWGGVVRQVTLAGGSFSMSFPRADDRQFFRLIRH